MLLVMVPPVPYQHRCYLWVSLEQRCRKGRGKSEQRYQVPRADGHARRRGTGACGNSLLVSAGKKTTVRNYSSAHYQRYIDPLCAWPDGAVDKRNGCWILNLLSRDDDGLSSWSWSSCVWLMRQQMRRWEHNGSQTKMKTRYTCVRRTRAADLKGIGPIICPTTINYTLTRIRSLCPSLCRSVFLFLAIHWPPNARCPWRPLPFAQSIIAGWTSFQVMKRVRMGGGWRGEQETAGASVISSKYWHVSE